MIPQGTRFIGISETVNLTERRSAIINAETQPYTVNDIRGYKVYTALLTQSSGDDPQTIYIGTNYGATLTIGVSYTIVGNDTTDFTNVGAPNNNVGTYFIATGTTPSNQNDNDQTYVSYNNGAPVATVLENTIGNVWFTYQRLGNYALNSDSLFIDGKTFINGASLIAFPVFNRMIYEEGEGFGTEKGYFFFKNSESQIRLKTLSDAETFSDDIISNPICIEIRVYN